MAGKKAPDFTLKSLNGTPVSLSEYKGKNVVLLDFWASWCPPCRAAMPTLDRLSTQYGSKGLKIISINQQESADKASFFVKDLGYRQPVLLDADGSVCEQYGVTVLPTFVLIDKEGKVATVHTGALFGSDLEGDICKELGIKYKPSGPFGGGEP